MSYFCDYCGDPLCPEICPEAVASHVKWIDSEEFKNREVEDATGIL